VRIRIQLRIRLLPFKDGKKIVIFFLIVCPQAHHLQSKKSIFLLKLFCLNVILQALFQSAQHIYEKREGSGSGFVPLTNGSGSGRPKNMRILRIRILNTVPLLTYLLPIVSEVEADRWLLRGGGGSRYHPASLLLGHLSNMLLFSVVFVIFSVVFVVFSVVFFGSIPTSHVSLHRKAVRAATQTKERVIQR
jgi:hypothetical protein